MVLTKKLPLNLSDLIRASLVNYQKTTSITFNLEDKLRQLLDFFYQRLKAYYKEQEASGAETGLMVAFSAAPSAAIEKPLDFHQRVIALQAFIQNSEAQTLVATAKRIHNILHKQAKANELKDFEPESAKHDAELALYQCLKQVNQKITQLLSVEHRDYQVMTYQLTTLASVIDAFFNQVMVMDEDIAVRNNRLALLGQVSQILNCFADFSGLSA